MNVKHVKIELDNTCPAYWVPQLSDMEAWLNSAATKLPWTGGPATVGVRIVDHQDSAALNRQYRGKDTPTNVLSFSAQLPESVRNVLNPVPLGDLAVCAPLVEAEAAAQGKSPEAHWAHLLTHGFLHLNGFRHDTEADAKIMETLEITVLEALGYTNPYLVY